MNLTEARFASKKLKLSWPTDDGKQKSLLILCAFSIFFPWASKIFFFQIFLTFNHSSCYRSERHRKLKTSEFGLGICMNFSLLYHQHFADRQQGLQFS